MIPNENSFKSASKNEQNEFISFYFMPLFCMSVCVCVFAWVKKTKYIYLYIRFTMIIPNLFTVKD